MRSESDACRSALSRGRFVATAVAAGAVAFAAAAPATALAQTGARTAINLQLDFLPFGRYAPYYYAVSEGMYARGGLDVTIASGTGTGPALQQLISGHAQVAFVDIPSMLVLMGRNPNPLMQSYAVLYAKAPETVFFIEGGPISKPKDLEGKRIATSPGSTDYELFPLFAAAQGIDASKVEWVPVDPAAKVGLLLAGKVDATTTYVLGLPGVQAGAKPGQRIGHFTYGDYGVHVYGNGVIATADFARDHAAALRTFVKTSLDAYEAAFHNPAKAVAAMQSAVPTLKPEQAVAELKIVQQLAYGPDQRAHGLGYQSPAGMSATYDAVEKVLLRKPLPKPVADFYTNADQS